MSRIELYEDSLGEQASATYLIALVTWLQNDSFVLLSNIEFIFGKELP